MITTRFRSSKWSWEGPLCWHHPRLGRWFTATTTISIASFRTCSASQTTARRFPRRSAAEFRATRGYVGNVAAAIALAVTDDRARGRIFNVGDEIAYTEREWLGFVKDAAGWPGEIRSFPDADFPNPSALGETPNTTSLPKIHARSAAISDMPIPSISRPALRARLPGNERTSRPTGRLRCGGCPPRPVI